ncbi:MAG: hypothetical protein ACI9WU_001051 [Myxococcota bacterium]|jgi:hypothetical protein
MTRISLIATLLLGLVPSLALAQTDERTGIAVKPPDQEGDALGGMIDGRFGVGMIDEDVFLTINVGTALKWRKLGVGIQVPLRLRISDNDPKADGVFREEDWDEPSDWTRVLRYVSWGQPNDPIYARLGVLAGTTLGHGTIVDRYYNVIDADHYQTGVQVHLDFDVAGGQTFLDNLLDPEIWAIRGYVRPFRLFEGMSKVLDGIYVGTTLAIDALAPNRIETEQNQNQTPVVDSKRNIVTKPTSVFLWGLDIGWALNPYEWWAATPYMDVNVLGSTGGAGFHLGMLHTFDIAEGVVRLGTRIEYRAMDGDYAPSYINSWYEVERFSYLRRCDVNSFCHDVPKHRALKDIDEAGLDDTRHGWHASMDITILNTITLSMLAEDYEGSNNANMMLRLLLPYIAGFKFSAYYAKRNFGGVEEMFDLDRGLLVSELKYKFWGPMFAYAQYAREWKVNEDRDGNGNRTDEFGRYETIDTFDIGVGVEFTF